MDLRRAIPWAAIVALVPVRVAGQGLPFHTESALTTAFEQRGVRIASGVSTSDDLTAITSNLVVLPWAPHQRVTTRLVIPLVYKRMNGDASGSFSRFGAGDLALSAKWAFFVKDRRGGTTRLALVATGTLPSGTVEPVVDASGSEIRSLRLGKGAVSGGFLLAGTLLRGRFGLTADLGRTITAADDGFRHGEATRYDIAVSIRFPGMVETIQTRTLQLYLEWNGIYTAQSESPGAPALVTNSGGHLAFLSPGAQWVVLPQMLIEVSAQIPVIRNLNGTQRDPGARLAGAVRVLFF
ncbi:MAG: transporter [Gemmatimonadales bacterium]